MSQPLKTLLSASVTHHKQSIQSIEKLALRTTVVISSSASWRVRQPILHLSGIDVHVIELMFAGAPCRVQEALLIAHETQGLVRVVVVMLVCVTWCRPEFDVNELVLRRVPECIRRVCDRCSVELWARRHAEHLENGRCHVRVAVDEIGDLILSNVRSTG